MSEKKYNSHIDKPEVHITASGAMFVRPFDIIRSKSGRAVIHRHASEEANNSNKEFRAASNQKINPKK